jgi:hypothetical protein
MTITDLAPLQSARKRALADLLGSVGAAVQADGFDRHEYAVQTLARAAHQLAPGASATLARRALPTALRDQAFAVVARVVTQCGDPATDTYLSGALARYVVC